MSLFQLYPHPATPFDFVIGFGGLLLAPLFLITPHTGSWRLIRAAIFGPISSFIFLYIAFFPAKADFPDVWGSCVYMFYLGSRTLQFFVFQPPEETCWRMQPHTVLAKSGKLDVAPKPGGEEAKRAPEPVPEPWTLAKYYWANSVFWSYRGIGWNYSCQLPPSSRADPYKPTSPRKAYLLKRLKYWVITILIRDLLRSYISLSSAKPFFEQLPGPDGVVPKYSDLTQFERGKYGIAVAASILLSMERTHVPVSMFFVCVGGLLGWEGEIFSPYGWPPLFGSLKDIWEHPGLSQMWSRSWGQYFRKHLYDVGWAGIGEQVLRLPKSGLSMQEHQRPTPILTSSKSNGIKLHEETGYHRIPQCISSASTPSDSGRTSPDHPLPTSPKQSTKPLGLSLVCGNFIKATLVFLLSGLIHDQGSYWLTRAWSYEGSPWLAPHPSIHNTHYEPKTVLGTRLILGPEVGWRVALSTTPFFVAQPFAITFEALMKRQWRAWKLRRYGTNSTIRKSALNGHSPISNGRTANGSTVRRDIIVEPEWLVFTERLIGFIWTWVWLGWSAGWFVEGLAIIGLYRRSISEAESFSLSGGIIWGKWYY